MATNLYDLQLDGELVAQCGGNLSSETESCVSIAPLAGTADSFAVGDTKPEGDGQLLCFTGEELDNFATKWVKDRGLTV
ncbi:DUF397 domain-containing protein [Kitasatospora sp. NPDC058162]|uniref:DUF397 domain-containing protein n=1 Tax=Kitasatospora sp. NPDC058162 TaxID=3346362 RepID=UPI0036DEB349